MKTLYVPEEDALYVRFSDARVAESEEIRPGVVLDYDDRGRIVAIEFLDASEQVAEGLASSRSRRLKAPGSPSLGELLAQGKANLQVPWLGLTGFFRHRVHAVAAYIYGRSGGGCVRSAEDVWL